MLINRFIPVLLLKNQGLVKTVKFKDPTYVGDPINAIKILNEKEVDEMVFLDITASLENREPQYGKIAEVATECFMPFCYGGGLHDLKAIEKIFNLGAEKITLNTAAAKDPEFVQAAARHFGSQSIIGSIDVKKSLLGKYEVFIRCGTESIRMSPVDYARHLEQAGVGEIFLNSIDRDGTMKGYDLELVQRVSSAVNIPVVAIGGAGSLDDMVGAIRQGGASAAGAGSLFVFQGKHRAVLITYPERELLERKMSDG